MVSATIKICSRYSFIPFWIKAKYSVGQTLYRCDLAKKGRLEKITIKKILLNVQPNPSVVFYKDTFNCLQPEYDLCEAEDAISLYNEYVANKQAEYNKYIVSKVDC